MIILQQQHKLIRNRKQEMTEKCYRVQFTAHLHKLTLALKMVCQIEVVWKRGQKVCESGKVALIGGQAKFDRKISISCNMIFNTKTKTFKQKITKFSVILTSQKGVKQAGDIEFDVAQYINQKQLNKKQYEQKLTGCPDKNAKLSFSLTGVLRQQLSMDAISQSSYITTQNTPVPQQTKPFSKKKSETQNNIQETPRSDRTKPEQKNQKVKSLQQQNKKIKQQLKIMQKIKQQNEQLRKKIKNQDFKKVTQFKQKIEKYKKQIQKIKSQIRANKKIEDQTVQIQKNILNCKIKIMKAFNYADEYRGAQLVDAIQNYCGIEEK